jgi:hypothetical protein
MTKEKTAPKTKKAKVAEKTEKTEKTAPAAEKTVKILSAVYGIEGKSVEICDKVKLGRKITNKLAGEDPAPKEKKNLIVKAEVDGTAVSKTFTEGEKLIF